MEYLRTCPKCGKPIYYKSKDSMRTAEKKGSVHKKCVVKTEEWNKKNSEALKKHCAKHRTGKSYEEIYGESEAKRLKKLHSENLTGRKRGEFSQEWRLNMSKAHKLSENFKESMQSKEYKALRRFIVIQKYYPGLSLEEWEEFAGERKLYYLEVLRITKQQPIEELEYYEKRGKTGVEGAYHLDHIYPISQGFLNNIAPEKIGNIKNLRMIPWLENLKKGGTLNEEFTEFI